MWFKVIVGMSHHWKMDKLSQILPRDCGPECPPEVWRRSLCGMILALLEHVATYAPEKGELTRIPASNMASACGWLGEPEQLMKALVESGWVDRRGARLYWHDWEKINSALSVLSTDRVRRHREKKRAVAEALTPAEKNDRIDKPNVRAGLELLKDFGLTKTAALDVAMRVTLRNVYNLAHSAKGQEKPAGYIVAAVKNGWSVEDYVTENVAKELVDRFKLNGTG